MFYWIIPCFLVIWNHNNRAQLLVVVGGIFQFWYFWVSIINNRSFIVAVVVVVAAVVVQLLFIQKKCELDWKKINSMFLFKNNFSKPTQKYAHEERT